MVFDAPFSIVSEYSSILHSCPSKTQDNFSGESYTRTFQLTIKRRIKPEAYKLSIIYNHHPAMLESLTNS